MRYCVYDYPNTRIIPDYRMWVTISAWNYAKLDCTSVDSGVGVHFFPSRAESPPLAATTPTREISWYHVQIHVAKKFLCNSLSPGTKRSNYTVERCSSPSSQYAYLAVT